MLAALTMVAWWTKEPPMTRRAREHMVGRADGRRKKGCSFRSSVEVIDHRIHHQFLHQLGLVGDAFGVAMHPPQWRDSRLEGLLPLPLCSFRGMDLRFEIFPADLEETTRFYVTVLGFELLADRRDEIPPYMEFRRGRVRIGVLGSEIEPPPAARRPPVGIEVVLEVDDVEAELERVTEAGWPIEEGLSEQSWGLTDFRILDPSGYYLRITNKAHRSGRD